jgi:hypothetical protein
MRFKLRNLGVLALAVGTMAACADNLQVTNLNNPDLGRVYADPSGVEGVVSTLFRSFHQQTQGTAEGLNSQSKAMALESYGQVANFGMALRAGIPRVFINNNRGNQVSGGNNQNWSQISRLMRNAATVAQAVDAYLARSATLGNAARDQRARGFAFMVNGLAMGTLAMGYDSVAIATPQTPTAAIPVFITPAAAVTEALAVLDSAIAIFSSPTAAGGEGVIPADWMGGYSYTQAQIVQVIRSYKARFRANVARTPAERAAVDWALVAADAAAGITSDVRIDLSGATGWSSSLDAGTFQTSASWHQISLMYNGMADTSGAYQAFIAQPYQTRVGMNVVVQTPDTRWPRGNDRATQFANSGLPLPAGQYIANRDPGQDQPDNSNPWGTSQYTHHRWFPIANNNGNGTYSYLTVAEINMLRAEALIRQGGGANLTTAMGLVNDSRTANGLPAFTDPAGVAPGGQGCVPRLPNGSCASLLEAMKYEKRMETQLTGYMQWFLDSRGWGDLVVGTALHWPVPFQEMDTRNLPFYDMPSAGTLPGAAAGTYGF